MYKAPVLKKEITYKGKRMELSSIHSVMVRKWVDRRSSMCRTLYTDDDGNLWCSWFGKMTRVNMVDVPSRTHKGKTVKVAVVDESETED